MKDPLVGLSPFDIPFAPSFEPPSAPPAVDPTRFRSLMSAFPSGVAIVTTAEPGGRPWGMTCSSVCSVALDPPTLLVCVRRPSPTLKAMLKLSTFTVNLLHDRARYAAELFASGTPDRFERVRWRTEPSFGGPHLVDEAHAFADCRVTRTVEVGDHTVVFGQVFRVEQRARAVPLLYGLREYSSWSPAPRRPEGPRPTGGLPA
ncbi:flavin reductase family protein [Streptosporangium sp. NPDC006013]|uniref:flavin reductase family protein n=1 Tax=Streptosporangium sp. NPDC006013 TaxID=3155596 RepID=UPI0033A0F908